MGRGDQPVRASPIGVALTDPGTSMEQCQRPPTSPDQPRSKRGEQACRHRLRPKRSQTRPANPHRPNRSAKTNPAISRLRASPTPGNAPRHSNVARGVRETCTKSDPMWAGRAKSNLPLKTGERRLAHPTHLTLRRPTWDDIAQIVEARRGCEVCVCSSLPSRLFSWVAHLPAPEKSMMRQEPVISCASSSL